jgi:hypothetical protein
MTKFAVITENGRVEFPTHDEALQYLTTVGGIRIEQVDEVIVAPVMESTVTLPALRSVMDLQGITQLINTAIENLPEPQKTIANNYWQYGYNIDRSSSVVLVLQQLAGLTNDQVDELFIAAQNLPL